MTKQIEAVYENGVLRPVEPIELPEGERLSLILITRDREQPSQHGKGDITRFFGWVIPLARTTKALTESWHANMVPPMRR